MHILKFGVYYSHGPKAENSLSGGGLSCRGARERAPGNFFLGEGPVPLSKLIAGWAGEIRSPGPCLLFNAESYSFGRAVGKGPFIADHAKPMFSVYSVGEPAAGSGRASIPGAV